MQSQDQALRSALSQVPPGWAWSRDPASVMGRTLTPLAAETVRFEQRAEALVAESTPGAATVMLEDYERVLGPDPCLAPAATFDARRLSVHARWTARGGASRAHFIELAANLGFAITIEEFKVARYGRFRHGQPRYGAAWAFAWRVTASATTIVPARYGTHRTGEPYRSWGSGTLECTLRRQAPAHTVLLFAYVGPGAVARYETGVYDRDTYDTTPSHGIS